MVCQIASGVQTQGFWTETREVLNAVVERLPDAVFLGNGQELMLCNEKALQMLEVRSVSELRRPIPELLASLLVRSPVDGRPVSAQQSPFMRALNGESSIEEQILTLPRSGRQLHVRSAGTPIVYQNEIIGAMTVITDITEQKRMEAALRRNEANLICAQRLARLGSWEHDLVTNELIWSDEIYRIFGYAPGVFSPSVERFLQAVHPQDRTTVNQAYESALREGRPYQIDHRVVLPDGTVRMVHEMAAPMRDKNGQVVKMVGTVQDVTERVEAETELHRLIASQQDLRESERARFAREIHDELSGRLAALKFELAVTKRAEDEDGVLTRLRDSEPGRQIDAAIAAMRRIIADLRPSLLDDLGLWAALEWQCQEFEVQHGIRCTCMLPDPEPDVTPAKATTIFRIFQDALAHVAAGRWAAWGQVRANADAREALILIDGKAAPGGAVADWSVSSSELFSMRERAARIGAVVDVTVGENGTTTAIRFPIG